MQDVGIPLLSGVIPIFTLIVIEIALSQTSLKSRKFRKLLTGKPSVIIHNGKILRDEMEKLRFNHDDLKEQLRIQGYVGIKDINFAILETNGQLSIIPKPQKQQVSVEDLKKNTKKGKKK